MQLVRSFAVCILLIPLLLSAQNVTISATPYTSDVQTFMLSDFNFSGRGTSASELFILTIINQTAQPQQCELMLDIYSQNYGTLAAGHTRPFVLEGNEMLRVTNQNLFSEAQQFSLQDYQIESVGNDLKSTLLATGRLPADTYIFYFQLLSADGAMLGETEIRFVITNPNTLDLLAPGDIASSAEEGLVYTPFPLFRWESNISTFRLTIAEQLPDAQDGLSPEEVMQQRVIFERTLTVEKNNIATSTDFPQGEIIPTTLFQYPVGGAFPLEAGKTYYWQLVGLVRSSGAPLEIPSEIWKFKIVGTGSAQILTPLQQQILNFVREMDESLLKPGGALHGYIPTETVTKNGVILKDDRIIDLLAKIVDGEIELLDESVE